VLFSLFAAAVIFLGQEGLSGQEGLRAQSSSTLKWGRPPSVFQKVDSACQKADSPQANLSEGNRPVLRLLRRARVVHDAHVHETTWEEDDSFAVQSVTANRTAGDRSVVVKRFDTNYDPFDEDDRLALLPDDPFDEPAGESIPEPTEDPTEDIERIEEAIEEEIRRGQSSDDLLDEAREAFLENGLLEEDRLEKLEEMDPLSDELDDGLRDEDLLQPEQDDWETPDFDLDQDAPEEKFTAEDRRKRSEELQRDRRESEASCRDELQEIEAAKISSIDLSIRIQGSAGEDYPYECAVSTQKYQPRQWPQITYQWKAAALYHKPLYFEQVQLERYGHSWGPYVQPIMSGVHFFGTLPILPYKMGIRTPNECVYTLGYYRPGSCAPTMIDPIPFTWRAALFEGAAVTGIPLVIP